MNLPVDDPPNEGAGDATTPDPNADGKPVDPEAGAPTRAGARAAASGASAAITRRKLDEIFGDVLPSTTRDERNEGRDPAADDSDERWYRDNRPPHHG